MTILATFSRMAPVGALLILSPAQAAQIYGTLTENARIAPGLQISIGCPDGTAFGAETNDSGSYSVRVDATGYCRFVVTNRPGQPSVDIYIYDQPSRYDFDLVQNADGSYALRNR